MTPGENLPACHREHLLPIHHLFYHLLDGHTQILPPINESTQKENNNDSFWNFYLNECLRDNKETIWFVFYHTPKHILLILNSVKPLLFHCGCFSPSSLYRVLWPIVWASEGRGIHRTVGAGMWRCSSSGRWTPGEQSMPGIKVKV